MSKTTISRRSALALGAALAAGGLVPRAFAAPSGRIVVAQGSDIVTLDASMDISAGGLNVLRNVFSQLTVINADGSIGPELAESWKGDDGATVWTFKLRDDAKFHDGTPVTVADVLWTFEKVKSDQRSPMRAYMAVFGKMEDAGGNAVRITLTKPFSAFDRHVSLIPVMSKAAYEKLGADKFAQQPVGSGPFRVVRWVKDDHIELEAVPGHWGGEPKVKTVLFRPVASEAARLAALQSGDVDIVAGLPPVMVGRLAGNANLVVAKVPSNRVAYLGANVKHPALADVRMRRAINVAFDRAVICKTLLRGLGEPSGQILAPNSFGFDPSLKAPAQDLAKARELVKAAGYDGAAIPFQFPNNRITLGNEVAQAIAGYLKEAGINVELQGMDYPAFFAIWVEKKCSGLFMSSYGPSIFDAELALSTLYETATGRGYWFSPELDALIAKQRAETDPQARKLIIFDIWQMADANMPFMPIYNEAHSYGVAKRVKWSPRPDERLLFAKAEVTGA